MGASVTAGSSPSSSWLDSALATAGIGHALSAGSLTGQTDTATIEQAAQRAQELGIGGAFDGFRSALTWAGTLAIGAEILLGLGLLVFLVWLVRKGAMEIFG